MRMNRWGLLAGFALLALTACDDGVADIGGEPVSILGNWVDTFATEYTITVAEWRQTSMGETSVYLVTTFDDVGNLIIAENSADNMFAPGKFSRFDWTQLGDRLFYCQSVFDADTADAAANAEGADPSDPTVGGCGGMFPWTELLVP